MIVLGLGILMGVAASAQWQYPPTKTVDAVDTYFGHSYKDPYRWLENLQDPEVEAWFKAQNQLTGRLLATIPARDELVKEWANLDKLNPATFSAIRYENGRVFYKKSLGGENVGKLYWRQGWKGEERLLFDPTTCKSGVTTTIQSFVPSWDGRYVALGLSSGGAEYSQLHVLDVEKGTLLSETVYPTFEVLGWAGNESFFYAAPSVSDIKSFEIGVNGKAKLHRVGTDFAKDVDFFSNKSCPGLEIQAKENPVAYIDESYPNYVIGRLYTAQNEMRVFYAPAPHDATTNIQWKVLCQRSDNLVRGFQFAGDYIYAVTHAGAPKYKVVRTRVNLPDWGKAETVVPEGPDSIEALVKCKHYLLIVYSDGVARRLAKYELGTGQISEIKLPASGMLYVECPDWRTDRCLVYIWSWTFPITIYDFDARENTFAKSMFNSEVSYPGFTNLVSEEVEVRGHDGTMIPLSIVHQMGIPMNGSNSCILEGYGAFGAAYPPYFNVKINSLTLRGVVYALAHVRGGGEKGEAWHKAGYKTTKSNTWKDFNSCAEYLIKQGYTSSDKLAGTGTSAGGILISRAITERPDLFRAAICNVGDANAMRLEFRPKGPLNIPEFGTVKDPVECQALYEMDGVQHVQRGVRYPAVMGVAGWNDRRVPAWQPGKFVAALQSASASPHPVLMMVNYDNGHFTEEKVVTFRDFANQMAFLLWQTGHKDFQPVK